MSSEKSSEKPSEKPSERSSAHSAENERPEKTKPYKFVVRLPMPMRDRIAEAALHHRRSMNSEIVARLEQSFSGIPSDATEQQIEPPMQGTFDALFRRDLKQDERELLRTFRRLSQEKRRALLRLLK